MRYKKLLLASIFSVTAACLHAQQYQNFTMKAPSRVIKTDTIIITKAARPAAPAIVASAPAVIKKTTPAIASASDRYKSVPLAGQKSYFGEMNDYVTGFVRQYLQVHNKTLSYVQGRSGSSFSLIDNILQQNNMPKELKYLAVIESALNHNAVSHAGAVGPWQLMESTARMMGLTVNGKRDDRTDWYKSTTAAAKYLTRLYGDLNDWLLVIAAYNSGPGPVQRAIARTGSHNFWDIKKYLPRETQGHVLAFIATASIFENMSKFIGLGSIPLDFKFGGAQAAEVLAAAEKKPVVKSAYTPEELQNMAIVRISEPLSIELMSQELKIDKKLLNKWNPDYELFIYNTYPTDYYSLRIPKDKLDNFVEKKEALTKRSRQIMNEQTM